MFKKLSILLVVVLAVGFLAPWGAVAQEDNILRLAIGADPEHLDPFRSTTTLTRSVLGGEDRFITDDLLTVEVTHCKEQGIARAVGQDHFRFQRQGLGRITILHETIHRSPHRIAERETETGLIDPLVEHDRNERLHRDIRGSIRRCVR